MYYKHPTHIDIIFFTHMKNESNKKPYFSIAIPTKDRGKLLSDLVNSIFDQDFTNYEIVIADNSHDNDSLNAVKRFDSNKIKYIKTGNLKMFENWNTCIDECSGKYLILLSDKTLLKRGALNLLYKNLINNNHKCITWDLDQIINGTVYIPKPTIESSYSIKSHSLLRKMLASDWIGFDFSPMHSNSCISMDLVNEIKNKFKSLCMEINPDYTMATQILLSIETIYRINSDLTILQRPALDNSYGNGSSFLKKTPLAKGFMNEHASWANRTYSEKDIPIKGNNFVLSIMLKDVYHILGLYKVNPNIYLKQEERIASYYHQTFKEILWRKSMGITMKNEINLWNHAFYKENSEIQKNVTSKNNSLLFYKASSGARYMIKKNIILNKLLSIYRMIKYKNIGVKYPSLIACLSSNTIK